jgi:hypothetical protein
MNSQLVELAALWLREKTRAEHAQQTSNYKGERRMAIAALGRSCSGQRGGFSQETGWARCDARKAGGLLAVLPGLKKFFEAGRIL